MSRLSVSMLLISLWIPFVSAQETIRSDGDSRTADEGTDPTSAKPGPTSAKPGPASAKPGINDNFLDPDLDVQQWIDRFEVESREVFHARDEIMRAIALQPGERVADVGAGTGFYTLMMAEAVGHTGWAYAIEISPKFVEHMVNLFDQRSVNNVTTVMCDDDSICLPPQSIDVAFTCDVYHHFEYPDQTLTSIHEALSEGGRLIVIDFERIPGVSREWTLGHVRAGKQTVIEEIQAAGFGFVAEREIQGFEENYLIEFRKR
jgi:ubiquinone/menaquinone biosynthesis C-methylase UbiE